MTVRGKRIARVVMALGAMWLFASLFMPWYRPEVGGRFSHTTHQSFVVLFWQGQIGNGWETLSVIDIYLTAVAVLALLTCGLSWHRARSRLFAATGIAALVGLGLIIYRLIEPAIQIKYAGPTLPGAFNPTTDISIQPRAGIFIALVSAVAVVAGSAWIGFRPDSLRRSPAARGDRLQTARTWRDASST
jgi:hypothetical protein